MRSKTMPQSWSSRASGVTLKAGRFVTEVPCLDPLPSYPMTPVDALLSALHAAFTFGYLTEDYWGERMAEFRAKVES